MAEDAPEDPTVNQKTSDLLEGISGHFHEFLPSLIEADIERSKKKKLPSTLNNVHDVITELTERHEKKRIFICCDGTWKNASGTNAPLTNVARLARCVDRVGQENEGTLSFDTEKKELTGNFGEVRQIVYYASGVGSHSSLAVPVDTLSAGITGAGIDANILNAYCFLCNNYNFSSAQDEIILAGFSRGAFTVRCLASFISYVGLLRRKGLQFLRILFKLWKQGDFVKLQSTAEKLKDLCLDVKIQVLAEWDTVSAMGGPLKFWQREYSSVIEKLSKIPQGVEHALFAFALDEKRPSFKPMLWTVPQATETKVRQCAFIGCHSDIGGGNSDSGLSTVSLLWMISKIQEFSQARFDEHSIFQSFAPVESYRLGFGPKELYLQNPCGAKGRIHESLTGFWRVPYYLSLTLWHGKRGAHYRNYPVPSFKVHRTVQILTECDEPRWKRCRLLRRYLWSPGLGKWTRRHRVKNACDIEQDEVNVHEKSLVKLWVDATRRWSEMTHDEVMDDLNWSQISRDIAPGGIQGSVMEGSLIHWIVKGGFPLNEDDD